MTLGSRGAAGEDFASNPSPAAEVDVVVIGGGVNGTGVARDAALRGLKVALFERNDIAFGASGNSSGLIHGGPRYMQTDPEVTLTSSRDSGYIQAIAPHLLFRVPFLMPIDAGREAKIMLELVDAFFGAYDRFQPLKRGKRHTRLTPEEMHELEPGLGGAVVGGVTFDEWGIDGARLCTANAQDAHEHGARIHNHTTVEAILRSARGAVTGVRYRDRLTGAAGELSARAVVNATGAWAPLTAMAGGLAARSAPVRPGKGIHVFFDRRLLNYAIVGKAIDGRQIFVQPWENVTVIGTTDDDFYGDLDHVRATSEEVRYLVQGIARLFPAIATARPIGTTAGVRPTLYEFGPNEDELSRDHRVVDHAADGAPGLYSMVGGKLASYRIFAEEMTDRLGRDFGVSVPCSTHVKPLPGGDRVPDADALARTAGIDRVAARRLVYRHGSRAARIVERIARRPREAAIVCACEPVIEAEVRHVIATEWACSVDDVARRTRLGLGSCGGMRCAARCGALVAEERELPPAEGTRQALSFLREQCRRRAPLLGPIQARQEALALAHVEADLGPLDREGDS